MLFKIGELVTTLTGEVGLIVETKIKFYIQYCRVLWFGNDKPKWSNSLDLHELCFTETIDEE
tara:strand:+ start:555 stop:740 length:186 start_codon:yes stop_codon:yes gene_type:complete